MKRILLFILLVCLINPKFIYSQFESDTSYLKVMTYNIHHAEGIDGKIDLERIAKLIRVTGVDLVALQEVDKNVERSLGINIIDSLAQLTKMNFYFDKNIDFGGGEYGNAILSRLPILSKYNFHFKMIGDGEQRGLLQTVVNILGSEILFMNTHLDFSGDDSERVFCVNQLNNEIKKYPQMPIIICGDFNDTSLSKTYIKMKENFSDVWEEKGEGLGFTYPSDYPEKRIDYIFYSNIKDEINKIYLEPISITILRSAASDHLPVIGEFKVVTNKNNSK